MCLRYPGLIQKNITPILMSPVENKPHTVVDDRGDVCKLLHKNPDHDTNPECLSKETTTCFFRLKTLAIGDQLLYPAIAMKHGAFLANARHFEYEIDVIIT